MSRPWINPYFKLTRKYAKNHWAPACNWLSMLRTMSRLQAERNHPNGRRSNQARYEQGQRQHARSKNQVASEQRRDQAVAQTPKASEAVKASLSN